MKKWCQGGLKLVDWIERQIKMFFSKWKERSLTCKVMTKLISVAILFYIVCLFVFALLPEWGVNGITGGWDWLSFVGTLVGTLFACWGVITTIESTHEATYQQAILSAKPMLNAVVFNHYDPSSLLYNEGVFFNYTVSERNITLEKSFYYLTDVLSSEYSDRYLVLRIKNIGLGAAVNIQPKLYKAIANEDRQYERIENSGSDDIYSALKIEENAKEADYSAEKTCVDENTYYEITRFNLSNDSSSFDIILNQKEYSGEAAHYFLVFTYSDMYGEAYEQKQYLLLTASGCRPHHISSQKNKR